MLLLNLLILTLSLIAGSEGRGKILGGYSVNNINKFPYIVQIERSSEQICGGSLIEPNMVITAAHCVYGGLEKYHTVRAGTTIRNFGGEQTSVVHIILPMKYDDRTKDWDVAILILAKNITNGINIKTINLYDGIVPENANVQVSGWGATATGTKDPSGFLQTVSVKVRNHQECVDSYAPEILITENMICANALNMDSCFGDSGGPFVYQGELAGIVSAGVGCGQFIYPGLYADVSKFTEFIDKAKSSYKQLMQSHRNFI